MKILFISFSDFKGGANIAAYSIYKSLKNKNYFFFTVYSKYKTTIEVFGNLKKNFYYISKDYRKSYHKNIFKKKLSSIFKYIQNKYC